MSSGFAPWANRMGYSEGSASGIDSSTDSGTSG